MARLISGSVRNASRLFVAFFVAVAYGCAHAAVALPGENESPEKSTANASGKSSECSLPPTSFVSALDFPSKYEGSGASRDELNSDADERYKAATSTITGYEKGLVAIANRYSKSRSEGSRKCLLGWLRKWADDGALLGKSTTHTGKSVRKWVLASISSAYFQAKRGSPTFFSGRESDKEVIESWIRKIATTVMQEWPLDVATKKINNHYYWTAWALVVSGLAVDDKQYFDYGISIYHLFENQLTSDGLLPNELARRSRALSYHVFALSPLAMIAAFSHYNNVSLATGGGSALSRLAETVFRGLNDASKFEALVGEKQELSSSPATSYAWLEPYCVVSNCTAAMVAERDKRRPLQSTRMGGNLTAMFSGGLNQ